MKKITNYLTVLLSFWLILNTTNSKAQCAANFSYTLNANGNVTFLANCVPANSITTQYYWNFGNSTSYTATGSPTASITYTANGTYSVNLFFITMPTCSNSITYTISVTNAFCNINAQYTYTLGSGGQVNFNSISTGTNPGTLYMWDFGDATPLGYGNPKSHTYNMNGVYTATLSAINNSATCYSDTVHTFTITNALNCTINSSFTYTQGSNGQVNFTSTSTGTSATTSYVWHYGDAGVGSGATSSHTYAANGFYTAYLVLTDGPCVDSISTIVTVNSLPCGLTALYNYTLGANGQVNFSSTSTGTTGATTYIWQYGDATANGSGVNTTHVYNTNGVYTATLSAINNSATCTSATVHTFTITNALNCTLNAYFNSYIGANGVATFTSTSTGTTATTSFVWHYGDATSGTGAISSHTYATNSWYYVTLVLTDGACVDSVTTIITVTTAPCNLNASFNYSVNGTLVNFASNSTGTTAVASFIWQFGDATSGSGQSTSHTYTPGTYIATLTVNNGTLSGPCTSSYTQAITVSVTPCNLVANFSHTVGSGGTANFANTSTGTNGNSTYFWDFGDGYTGSGQTPSHTYSSAGAYNVLLLVNNQTNPICIDTIVQSVNVTGIPCVANSSFSLAQTTTSLVWNATPSSPWNVVAATWSWGDNSTSNTLYTSHTYSASGTYSICLSVTVSCGASSSTCVNQFIFRSSEQTAQMIQVNVVAPALIPAGIKNSIIENTNLSIYPNPNNGQFEIKMDGAENETVNIKVYNLIGTLVYETETTNETGIRKIDLDNASNGVYFVKINSNNKEITQKIIVNK